MKFLNTQSGEPTASILTEVSHSNIFYQRGDNDLGPFLISSHKIHGFRVSLSSHFTLTFVILISLKENVSRNKLEVGQRSPTEMGEEEQGDQHSSSFP